MPNMKKYILTAVTLGLIAMASGLLIGATNLVTKGPIAEYEKEQFNNGVVEVFGEGAKADINDKKDMPESFESKYVTNYYIVSDANDLNIGYLFMTNGSNSYGKISLIVGYTSDTCALKGFSVLKNEQSFASTLKKKYITLVQSKERDYTDVSCGATYGAKLIRNMIDEASDAANVLKGA